MLSSYKPLDTLAPSTAGSLDSLYSPSSPALPSMLPSIFSLSMSSRSRFSSIANLNSSLISAFVICTAARSSSSSCTPQSWRVNEDSPRSTSHCFVKRSTVLLSSCFTSFSSSRRCAERRAFCCAAAFRERPRDSLRLSDIWVELRSLI